MALIGSLHLIDTKNMRSDSNFRKFKNTATRWMSSLEVYNFHGYIAFTEAQKFQNFFHKVKVRSLKM
jgi:hypothetical protein